jgi:hypothetical protein
MPVNSGAHGEDDALSSERWRSSSPAQVDTDGVEVA